MKMRTSTNTQLIKSCFLLAIICASLSSQAQFVKKTDISGSGRWSAMSFTVNNKIYAGGGYIGGTNEKDWQMYDPTANTWTSKSNMPGGVANRSAGVTFVINGKAYMGLGAENYLSFTTTPNFLSDLWEYDPAMDKWTQKLSLPDSGRAGCGVFIVNNKAYIVGGETSMYGDKSSDTWEYDPATNKWTSKKSYPEAIRNPFAFSIGSNGYISCGVTIQRTEKTYQYNPSADSWTPKADFPDSARDGGASFVAGGKAIVGLGCYGKGQTPNYPTTFYTYDAAADKWSFLTGKWAASGRQYGIAEVIGNKAYIGLGWKRLGTAQTFYRDMYEVDAVALLGVEETNNQDNHIRCYPNPARGSLNIVADDLSPYAVYSLYHISGQKVLTGMLQRKQAIDVHELPAGQYILEVLSDQASGKTKVTLY